jgi:hypothetical protein
MVSQIFNGGFFVVEELEVSFSENPYGGADRFVQTFYAEF